MKRGRITKRSSLQERNILLDEIIRRHSHHDNVVEDLSTDVQVLEAQRVRLTLLEEKIKEVLAMLRSLNSMVNSATAKLILI